MKSILMKTGLVAATLFSISAFSATRGNETQYSFIPYTSYGYVGANIGRSDFKSDSCEFGFKCDDSDVGGKIFTGGKFNNFLGAELGYVNLGSFDRNGGDKKAQGVDFHLLGNVPLGQVANLYVKAGGIYAWTKTTATAPFADTGSEREFNWTYGAGVQFDVNPQWAVRADWDQYRLKFADGRDNVALYSVGALYKF